MKHPNYNRVIDILRERELELFTIRNNFDELQNKFLQLENAFETNLRVQRRLESEVELCKFRKEKSRISFTDEFNEKNAKSQTVLGTQLTEIRLEKERWKDAFLHQKKITDKQKLEHEHLIDTIHNESEKILESCRQSSEKHFRELLKLQKNTSQKLRYFKEAHDASQARTSLTSKRVLELANVLETLKMFRGVKTQVVCERAVEALRSLQAEEEKSYQQGINSLRQVTWSIDENDNKNETFEILQTQNAVLRQVVKSLKRRFQEKSYKDSGSDENSNVIHENNSHLDNTREFEENVEESVKPVENEIAPFRETEEKQSDEKTEKSMKEAHEKCEENKNSSKSCLKPRIFGSQSSLANEIPTNNKKCENKSTKSVEFHPSSKRINVDAFESHKNGIPYEEYTFCICDNRQFRIRHPKTWTTTDSTMVVEFVDSEKDFEEATIDRTIFYLGDKVEKIVSLNKSGVHCSVQTNRLKTAEKSIQTAMTSKGFSRINAGVGILNTEKRAMERSLMNLERTVAKLKKNALEQARSMIKNDVKVLGDEFYDCVERLER